MSSVILFGCIFVLISIHSSSQDPVPIPYFAKKHSNEDKIMTSGKTSQILPIQKLLSNNSNQKASMDHGDNGLQTLCIQETNFGIVAPCDGKNDIPACIDTSTGYGGISKCKDMTSEQVSPLCFVPHLYLRFVVSCGTSPDNLCFSYDSGFKGLEFCWRKSKVVCLGEGYTLQLCYLALRRHQAQSVPNVPVLDDDDNYEERTVGSIRVEPPVVEEYLFMRAPVTEIIFKPVMRAPVTEIIFKPLKQDKETESEM